MNIEDLLIDFDEMGFAPMTICPNPDEYAYEWKMKLVAEINRQQAEIERLNKLVYEKHKENNKLNDYLQYAKADTVKELAERLKDRIVNFPSMYPIENATLAFLNGSSHRQLEILEIIDNIVKEMAGDTE